MIAYGSQKFFKGEKSPESGYLLFPFSAMSSASFVQGNL